MMVSASMPPACRAPYVFAQVRATVGGGYWNAVAQTTAYGRATMEGLRGTARLDDDLSRGRYAQRFSLSVVGSSAEVDDGTTVWAQDHSGGVHAYDAPFPRRRAVTSAYLTRRGYLDPRTTARLTCLGTRVEGNRSVTVIRVQPRGGIPADLAIDVQTHLLASVTERLPITTSVTTYADYRAVDDVVLPFSIMSGTKAEPADGYAVAVTRYRIRSRARDADFAKPTPANGARMVGRATSTTVPMLLEGRQLLVWASIDGRAPMPFILDTGGHAILTTLAAKTLGLRAYGAGESGGAGSGTIALQFARVRSVRIGGAELLDQPFLVIPYPYSFYERGRKTPLAGILGLEFFERYAIRLDYGARTVTFTPLATFRSRSRGTRVPFTFQDDMPLVDAAPDGHVGLFGADTGNAGSLILFGPFLQRTGLLARYPAGSLLIGHGTGGTNTARRETLRSFRLGGHRLVDVAAAFTQMTSGSFSSWTEAGNLGFSILSRFVPTFDYAHQTLSLDHASSVPPTLANLAGLGTAKNGPDAFDVVLVRPNTPSARAGIVAGDHITAIDGTAATAFSQADFITRLGRPGRLTLVVLHGAETRTVPLVLR
jgi:hypothetical protein